MYQLLIILFPLITVPFVSRVLGSNGVGIYAFTDSIVQYFILFGTLGIGVYGSKSIAIIRDDKNKLSKTFLSIYGLQLVMSTIAIIFYLLVIKYGTFDNKEIMYIQILALISCLVDCSWFFNGLEKFKQIILRNTVVRLASLVCLFTFVKDADDLPIYTLIMTGTALVGQMVLWMGMKTIYIHSTDRIKRNISAFKAYYYLFYTDDCDPNLFRFK